MTDAKTITVQEAAERLRESGMRIGTDVLRTGLLTKAFPFGLAIKTETSVVCWVFPAKLEAWIKEFLIG